MIPITLLRSAINFALRNSLSIYPEARDSACFRQVVGWSDFPRCKRLIQPRQKNAWPALTHCSSELFGAYVITFWADSFSQNGLPDGEREERERRMKTNWKMFWEESFHGCFRLCGIFKDFRPGKQVSAENSCPLSKSQKTHVNPNLIKQNSNRSFSVRNSLFAKDKDPEIKKAWKESLKKTPFEVKSYVIGEKRGVSWTAASSLLPVGIKAQIGPDRFGYGTLTRRVIIFSLIDVSDFSDFFSV